MSLTLRPNSVNMYAFSKLLYRSNSIDLRAADMFKSNAKSFSYAELLAKPCELTLFRSPKEGGLGFKACSKGSLITTFLQTAISPKFTQIPYHNAPYRHYVLNETIPPPAEPGNFPDDFFSTLKSTCLFTRLENLAWSQQGF